MLKENNVETLSTGTTTVAIACKDGVILAADRRATAGGMVVSKAAQKVQKVHDDLYVTTAGTVSDVQLLVKLLRAELKLKSIRSHRDISVKESANLLAGLVYSNIRKFSVIPGISHFIVGGKDTTGFYVYDIYPDGSITQCDDYIASGSGSIFSYGVLETLYKPNINVDEGKSLAIKSLNAALQRDTASGNGVDIVAITAKGSEMIYKKTINSGIAE